MGVSLLTYRGVGEDELIKAGQNGYTCHHVHVYGHVKGEEKTIVEDCTIWIGRLDNPAFGKSYIFHSLSSSRCTERQSDTNPWISWPRPSIIV